MLSQSQFASNIFPSMQTWCMCTILKIKPPCERCVFVPHRLSRFACIHRLMRCIHPCCQIKPTWRAVFLSSQVTWPAYFVEFVRTVEEQRRREGVKAAAEADAAAVDDDGVMSVSEEEEEESSSGGDSDGSSSKRGKRRRGRRGEGSDGEEEEEEEEEEAETDEEESLETLCLAFEAGEHHLLPLEMKVQAIEYLVDRAMEVRKRRGFGRSWLGGVVCGWGCDRL